MRIGKMVGRNLEDFETIISKDRPYVEAFCLRTSEELIDFIWNEEDFPSQGLTYFFSDNLGGYSIKGIKNTLDGDK